MRKFLIGAASLITASLTTKAALAQPIPGQTASTCATSKEVDSPGYKLKFGTYNGQFSKGEFVVTSEKDGTVVSKKTIFFCIQKQWITSLQITSKSNKTKKAQTDLATEIETLDTQYKAWAMSLENPLQLDPTAVTEHTYYKSKTSITRMVPDLQNTKRPAYEVIDSCNDTYVNRLRALKKPTVVKSGGMDDLVTIKSYAGQIYLEEATLARTDKTDQEETTSLGLTVSVAAGGDHTVMGSAFSGPVEQGNIEVFYAKAGGMKPNKSSASWHEAKNGKGLNSNDPQYVLNKHAALVRPLMAVAINTDPLVTDWFGLPSCGSEYKVLQDASTALAPPLLAMNPRMR